MGETTYNYIAYSVTTRGYMPPTDAAHGRKRYLDLNPIKGPWGSQEEFDSFWSQISREANPINGTEITLVDQNGVATKKILSAGQWVTENLTGGGSAADLTDIEARLEALEADKNAALAAQITASLAVSPARFYKGIETSVSASGTVSLPSGITASKISSIELRDNNDHQVSNFKTSSVSLSGITTTTASVPFTFVVVVSSPFARNITKTATCTVCNPVYLKVVGNSVDTKEEAFTAAADQQNLVYTNSLPVTSMKGQSKSLTFAAGDRIAVVCGDSGLKARGNAMLADYNWVVNGESVTDNGITYKVYVSGPIGVAETRTVNFS